MILSPNADKLFNMNSLRPLQDAYHAIPSGDTAARKAYRDANPLLLAAYNRFYGQFMEAHPDLAKTLDPTGRRTRRSPTPT